ncbi:BMC domain-containing protein [Clostridium chauvoei]|uniref:BMC domain-containing protein n=2 Tax=Clostridium chauvoei TaxID=46867 RepID=A0ABD4RG29_9CLOT|nr:BMC domain-containing protein [Clostridium chauvoei]ATD55734.1 propanediol utilization protein [Clostridium chauvoei]ATD56590.1 propanediol utilization protein [Clostridium chauvoei]MBX7280279.1 BMC domain-containing protein [Clostridium chauvoei]MBX7282764.1 BMC domain-containing protein [Clostridium chauvoei]MBX7285170.1 BMC domain-containing protein [Clostridium chauvoei]
MKALGLIETRGLLAAIESADTMLKAADVSIFDKTYVGGGLVSVSVTGDVGAVKAAVEAGVAAVKKLDSSLLVSEHVIPRPHEELDSIIGIKSTIRNIDDSNNQNEDLDEDNSNFILDNLFDGNLEDEKKANSEKVDLDNLQKESIDNLVKDNGIEKTIEVLNKLKLRKLRTLAKQYTDLGITNEMISKASKKLLITKIEEYYK